jgi:predicted permease
LWKAPGYSIGSALILAIGIGATTSVFTIFDTVIRRGFPYPHAERLFHAFEQNEGGAQRGPSYLTYRDWIADSSMWKGPVEGIAFVRGSPTWIDGPDGSERSIVSNVSRGFFKTMGVTPILGRTFSAEEETRSGNRVVVISFDAWRRYYGGDRSIIGRTITVDSAPTIVIGVMPKGVVFPQWSGSRSGNTAMWAPIAHIETTDPSLMKRGDRADLRVVARLRTVEDTTQARVALSAIGSRLAGVYPAESKGWTGVSFANVRDGALGSVRQLVTALAGAVGLVLLLACANVANLAFVRGASRAREIAIRAALGAGRTRVLRQLMTESVAISLVGCAAGLVITFVTLSMVRIHAVDQLAGIENVGMQGRSVIFALGVTIFAAIVSAIAPALRASSTTPSGTMRSGAHSATSSRRDGRIRSALVVGQLALAVILLVGTGLFVRSLRSVVGVPLGFDPGNLVTTGVTPSARYGTAQDALALYKSIMERVAQIPGVEDVAFVNHAPLGFGSMPTTVTAEGRDAGENSVGNAAPLYRTVSASYLRTMKMQLSAGRWFTDEDMRTHDGFVLNETLAAQLFPGDNPIGKRIVALRAARARPDFGQRVHGVVIGVVKDMHTRGQELPVVPEIYVPFTLETWPWGSVIARTNDVTRTIPLIREALRDIDPTIPEAKASAVFNGAGPMMARLDGTTATRKLMLVAVGVFAVAALFLAAIGLYSVVSYGVSQRTREVGVRVALGATDRLIVRLILGEGTVLALLGVTLGCAAALGLTRLIQSMLFNTPTTDVVTYVLTTVVLVVTAAIACYLPARRAARLSPVEAIRGE